MSRTILNRLSFNYQSLCWLFYRLTKAQFDLQGKTLTDADLEERIKSIFSQCDLNTDGKITEEEFVKAGATIAEMFELEAAEDE